MILALDRPCTCSSLKARLSSPLASSTSLLLGEGKKRDLENWGLEIQVSKYPGGAPLSLQTSMSQWLLPSKTPAKSHASPQLNTCAPPAPQMPYVSVPAPSYSLSCLDSKQMHATAVILRCFSWAGEMGSIPMSLVGSVSFLKHYTKICWVFFKVTSICTLSSHKPLGFLVFILLRLPLHQAQSLQPF